MCRIIGVLFLLTIVGCQENKLHVLNIVEPEYPANARLENLQGTVVVNLHIGADGKVRYAKGRGAPDILVQAAEENARQWTFGPLPEVAVFPMDHTLEYVYKLEGKPLAVAPNPVIKTFLTDRIEISATPLVSDYPPSKK
jgi:TonB family protein